MQNSYSTPPKDDRARAECYGLIANLFLGRADVAVLRHVTFEREQPASDKSAWKLEIVDYDPAPNAYSNAFRALQDTCRNLGESGIREEYAALFFGGSRGSVSPFTSRYAAPDAPDRHLHALREYLVNCGLARRDSAVRFEDHVSSVCDVMRLLIERGRPLDEQLAFFDEFVRKSVGAFCDALDTRKAAVFYRAVAALARAFIQEEFVTLRSARVRELDSSDRVEVAVFGKDVQ